MNPLTDTDAALQWILTSLLKAGMLNFFQRLLIQIVIPLWYCSHGNQSNTALRACSSSELEKVSSQRLVLLLSSDDPGPWDPRDPTAVEPSLYPSMFHDLAEVEPLETNVAFVPILHMRVVRELSFSVRVLGFCSISVHKRHLGREGIGGLFNTGNSGGDHTHGFIEGLHVVVKICESTRAW